MKHSSLGEQLRGLEDKIKTTERLPPDQAPKTVAELRRRQREQVDGD